MAMLERRLVAIFSDFPLPSCAVCQKLSLVTAASVVLSDMMLWLTDERERDNNNKSDESSTMDKCCHHIAQESSEIEISEAERESCHK